MKKPIQIVVSTPVQGYTDSDGVERKIQVFLSSGLDESHRREILKKAAEKQKSGNDSSQTPTEK